MTPEEREEIKRHFGVVAEGLRSDIRLVADGVAMNSEHLERLEAKVDAHDARFGRLEGNVGRLEGNVGRLEGKVDRLEGKVDRLQTEFCAFREETREGFAELRAQIKLSYAELDRRLTTLESGQVDLQGRVERLEAKLAS